MIQCKKCNANIDDNAKFCTYCGAEVKQEEILIQDIPINMNSHEEQLKKEKNFFIKLEMGEYGLAKTFWLYGFVIRVLTTSILKLIPNKNVFIVAILLSLFYDLLVMMGTWRAANQYQGLKIWALLAKALVILGIFMSLGVLSMISKLF